MTQLDRFREEAFGAALHCLHRGGDVPVRGDHDDHWSLLARPLEDLEPRDVGEEQVQQDHRGILRACQRAALLARSRLQYLMTGTLEVASERRADVRLVERAGHEVLQAATGEE